MWNIIVNLFSLLILSLPFLAILFLGFCVLLFFAHIADMQADIEKLKEEKKMKKISKAWLYRFRITVGLLVIIINTFEYFWLQKYMDVSMYPYWTGLGFFILIIGLIERSNFKRNIE